VRWGFADRSASLRATRTFLLLFSRFRVSGLGRGQRTFLLCHVAVSHRTPTVTPHTNRTHTKPTVRTPTVQTLTAQRSRRQTRTDWGFGCRLKGAGCRAQGRRASWHISQDLSLSRSRSLSLSLSLSLSQGDTPTERSSSNLQQKRAMMCCA